MQRREFFKKMMLGVAALAVPTLIKSKPTQVVTPALDVSDPTATSGYLSAADWNTFNQKLEYWQPKSEYDYKREYDQIYRSRWDEVTRKIIEEEDAKFLACLDGLKAAPTPAYYLRPDFDHMPFGFDVT